MKLSTTTRRMAMATLICGLLTGMATAGYQVKVKNPIRNSWINGSSQQDIAAAKKRVAVLSSEHWVVFMHNGQKEFESGGICVESSIAAAHCEFNGD